MGESYRIRTNILDDSDKYLTMKLDQDFDRLDVLSLSINQRDAYDRLCSDYGAVAGRVVVNRGFGIPNAKVSIFIPIDEVDQQNEEIRDLYPFETVRDTDTNDVRYNTLPKNRQYDCHTPVGTVPSKREILDNETLCEIYGKYYKYTAVTNDAGDFLIFGVPVGNHTIHMDVDLSDIGFLSRRPYHFIQEGHSPSDFASPTKFKKTENLENMAHIKTQNKGINVRPFWGDEDSCQVGITRVDFNLNYEFNTYAMFMGGIFGDTDKNSVNKNCRPRSKMGEICEQNTTEGTIEMIRNTPEGFVEEFSVNGGRVIDENGAWAYLIPMNLDNVVTDEFGNTVPSEDSTVGVSTRAQVRFKIGMDVTGNEGRVRKRAKYLVPHNPDTPDETDFSFGQSTSKQHFKDFYWNKIYTVSNHIPRYQGNRGVIIENNRNFAALKNVDECPGLNNPAPYNKINPKVIPLFNILCTILFQLSLIISFINFIFIPVINAIISVINAVVDVVDSIIETINNTLCDISLSLPKPINKTYDLTDCHVDKIGDNAPDPVGCITVKCESQPYAPGCESDKGIKNSKCGSKDDCITERDKLLECWQTSLAEELGLYEYDFYNDWLNGSLYAFLFKHKSKNDGRQKFCAYNCNDFDDTFDNDNYNSCKNTNLIVELCYEDSASNYILYKFSDGIVYFNLEDEEFYYPPIFHQKSVVSDDTYKLYATDIVNIGSMLTCDPDGVPFIFDQLGATTYKVPPLVDVEDEDGEVDVAGMQPLLFDLSCLAGITTDSRHCTNLRRICELDVDLDESDIDFPNQPDDYIGSQDMSDNILARNVFTYYNTREGNHPVSNPNKLLNDSNEKFEGGISTRLASSGNDYFSDFSNNEENYIDFRNSNFVDINNNNTWIPNPFPMFERSYYFYFGLKGGRTAYEKAASKFFQECDPDDEDSLILSGDVTNATTYGAADGAIDLKVLNGKPFYNYSWTGPNNYSNTINNQDADGGDISGLEAGFYTVDVIGSTGRKGTATFQVKGPPPLSCFSDTESATHSSAEDGSVIITVNGGNSDYDIEVINESNGNSVCTETLTSKGSFACTGLSSSTYSFFVEDSTNSSNGGPLTCSGITEVDAPPKLEVEFETKDVTCFGDNDGFIDVNIVSGTPLYSTTAETANTNSYYKENGMLFSSLSGDPSDPVNGGSLDYDVTVIDDTGQKVQQTFSIYEPAELIMNKDNQEDVFCNGKSDGRIEISIQGGRPPYTLKDGGNIVAVFNINQAQTAYTYDNLDAGSYSLEIEDFSGCTDTLNTINLEEPNPLEFFNIQVESDHNVIVTAQGGNPELTSGYNFMFRISACECSGSTFFPDCNEITSGYEFGTTGSLLETFNFKNSSINTDDVSNGGDYDHICSTDTGFSEVLKIEITDNRVVGEYGGSVNCNDNPSCLATKHIAITNDHDSNGNIVATGYVDASGWDSNLDNC